MTRDEEIIIIECEEIMAERREHREWIQGLIAEAEAAKPAPVVKVGRGSMPEGWAPVVGTPARISDKPDWMFDAQDTEGLTTMKVAG